MKIRIVVNTDKNNLVSSLDTQGGPSAWYLRKLADLFKSFSLGAWNSNTILVNNVVASAGVITFSGLPTADDTVTVCNVIFTAKASASTAVQFTIGADAAATAANLVAKLNAHSTVSKMIVASNADGVITLTSLVPGQIGNALQLSENANNTAVTAFAGGTEGNTNTFAHGL